MKGDTIHDATWNPTEDYVDEDGKISEVFNQYIKIKGILRHWNSRARIQK